MFDGHGGVDAARYAAVHVHTNVARQPELPTDPARALREAFQRTDEMFLGKAKREVRTSERASHTACSPQPFTSERPRTRVDLEAGGGSAPWQILPSGLTRRPGRSRARQVTASDGLNSLNNPFGLWALIEATCHHPGQEKGTGLRHRM